MTAVKPLPPRSPRLFALDLADEQGRATALHSAASQALAGAHFYKPEKRPFWPHLTFARVKRGAEPPPALNSADPPGDAFDACEVTLYRSILRPRAPSTSLRSVCDWVDPRRKRALSRSRFGAQRPMQPMPAPEEGPATVVRRGPKRKSMFDLSAALDRVSEWGGSDLHLKHGSPPLIRLHGELQPIPSTSELTPEETERALEQMLTEPSKLQEFDSEGEVDFSYEHRGDHRARFRVNAFRQLGGTSLVCRAIPDHIRSIEELALPPVIAELAQEERGIVLVTGTDRLGQDDHDRGHDRPDQLDQVAPHRDDRGPDRGPAPRQALGDQPARGRHRHRVVRGAPCAGCCARTRT